MKKRTGKWMDEEETGRKDMTEEGEGEEARLWRRVDDEQSCTYLKVIPANTPFIPPGRDIMHGKLQHQCPIICSHPLEKPPYSLLTITNVG